MEEPTIVEPAIVAIVYDLFIILTAGWISGVVTKRLGFSMLVGYLLAGAVIGHGALGLVPEDAAEGAGSARWRIKK